MRSSMCPRTGQFSGGGRVSAGRASGWVFSLTVLTLETAPMLVSTIVPSTLLELSLLSNYRRLTVSDAILNGSIEGHDIDERDTCETRAHDVPQLDRNSGDYESENNADYVEN